MNYGNMSFPKTIDFKHILYNRLSRLTWYCFILFGLIACDWCVCVCERLNKTKELV